MIPTGGVSQLSGCCPPYGYHFKMLTFFLQNPKQILSKTQILENVFDLEGNFVDENTIAVNIRRLREKIEDDPAAPVYIKNIRGLGYIWNQEVKQ